MTARRQASTNDLSYSGQVKSSYRTLMTLRLEKCLYLAGATRYTALAAVVQFVINST